RIRDGLCSSDEIVRAAAIERQLCGEVATAIAERLLTAYREAAAPALQPDLPDVLRRRMESVDPYIRSAALYALARRGEVDSGTLSRLSDDENEMVRETARHFQDPTARETDGTARHRPLLTLEKILALRSAPIFSRLSPEELAELARSSRETRFGAEEILCREGETGDEVFILLEGSVLVSRRDGSMRKTLECEKMCVLIGEMAVLDPAPRSATVVAGKEGSRVLRLGGEAFRHALEVEPGIAGDVIRTLAQRLRGAPTA